MRIRSGWLIALCAMVFPFTPSASAQERIGQFFYQRELDPITDADESRAWTIEAEPTALRTAVLSWRCDGMSRIEAFIAADEYLNSGGNASVRWRFDRNPPSETQRWSVSTSGTGAFLSRLGIARFTDAARAASNLVMRVTDYRGVEYDLRFGMEGATEAIGRLPCEGDLQRIREEAAEQAAQQRRAAAEQAAQQRRAAAELEDRRRRTAELQEARRLASAPPQWATVVGNPSIKRIYPLGSECWRKWIATVRSPVFFRSEDEARGEGYARASQCWPGGQEAR